jgi:K+-transporting ATPase ATPase A chain
MPLNPRGLGAIAPSTIFNTVISFSTNTDIQHYSGDVAFSNFSQIFFCLPMFFLSAAIGFCALTAIIRALRSDPDVGNFFSICGAWSFTPFCQWCSSSASFF